jgi:hypothetical protein
MTGQYSIPINGLFIGCNRKNQLFGSINWCCARDISRQRRLPAESMGLVFLAGPISGEIQTTKVVAQPITQGGRSAGGNAEPECGKKV